MADNGDMEAHVRDFTAAKRRVEEHSVQLTDIVYRTLFLLSMPTTYQMMVTALEGQSDISLEAAQNRLLDDYRKRGAQAKNGTLMTAMHTNAKGKGRKGGNSSSKSDNKSRLHCTHCGKQGHVESTCWEKHPELRPKKQQSGGDSMHIPLLTPPQILTLFERRVSSETALTQCQKDTPIIGSLTLAPQSISHRIATYTGDISNSKTLLMSKRQKESWMESVLDQSMSLS